MGDSKERFFGKVKFFDQKKGWGFIENEKGGTTFCHYSDIIGAEKGSFKTLTENDYVEFSVLKTSRGDRAERIKSM